MTDLQIFNNPEFGEIRTITEDGKTLFCGNDVAKALGYAKPKNAIAAHCKGALKRGLPTNGGIQEMNFIPIGDVFRLGAKSELPGADKFESWIFDEVLPAIHETGAYVAPQAQPPATLDGAAMQAFTAAVDTLTATVQTLVQRMDAQGTGWGEMRALPPTPDRNPFDDDNPFTDSQPKPSSTMAKKLWMRLVNEKLDLLSSRFGKSNNAILHKIYQDMEEALDTVMDDERYRVMEEQGLEKCSVLLAIFFDPELRDYFQRYIDHNLAPENRGW